MTPSPPRLRSDLTIRRQESASGGGEGVFVVKDAATGAFFRFGETEQFIAQQLDGATPLDVVRQRTEARFAGSLAPQSLEAFVRRLKKAGLLEGDDKQTGPRGRIRGSPLYLRVALFDPDQLFDRLVRRVRFCFTPHFLVISAVLILLATSTTVAHWSEIPQDLTRLYQLSSIPLFLLVTLVMASAHEFAHGLTCKRFGGEVHELGFLLIYFTPAFYTNVSDAWLFPEKTKRLWVGFAGPYFELFLWALATLTWRLTDVETNVNHVALMVMTLSGIKTLLNFNPFIKLDGYYLLSDYLELPNLRKKSFRYVGSLIKRLVGGRPGHRVAADISRRERRVYLAYGMLGSVASLALLVYVVVTAGGYLIENHQPMSLLLVMGLAGITSRRKVLRLFGRSAAPSDPEDDGDSGAEPRLAESAERPAPTEATEPAPSKKAKRPRAWRRRAGWTALSAAGLALVLLGRMNLRIGGAFTVLPEENADVRAQVEGIIEHIAVREGDHVQAGDLITRLSNHALVNELRKTESLIQETRANLKKLEAGPTAEEIAAMKAGVTRAESRLRFAQNNVTRIESLFATSAATRQELEAAQEVATAAENDVAEARARLDVLVRRNRPEDLEASRARLASLETQQRFLEGEVRELTVVSPVTGIVATPARQLKEMERQLVGRGALIAKVYDFTTVMAQIVASEKDIADIHAGQPVTLRVRAYPGITFHGTVTAIATAADGSSTVTAQTPVGGTSAGGSAVPGRTFIVTTRIDNRDLLLKPGMTGWAKVSGGPRRISSLLTRRLARTVRVDVWSWW